MTPLEDILVSECDADKKSAWIRQRKTAKSVWERFNSDYRTVLLADEVGMGKTFSALAAIAHHIYQAEKNDRRVLLVVPSSEVLVDKWERDINTFNSMYVQKDKSDKKRLRPIVLDSRLDLVKNLNDYGNIIKLKQYDDKKFFISEMCKWYAKKNKRRSDSWQSKNISRHILDESEIWTLDYTSWLSPRSMRLFFEDCDKLKESDQGAWIHEIMQEILNGNEVPYNTSRKLFKEFLEKQDFFEANILIIQMGTLHNRPKLNSQPYKDYALLYSLIAAKALAGKWPDTVKRASRYMCNHGLSWEPVWNKGFQRISFTKILQNLRSYNPWNLSEAISNVLKQEEPLEDFLLGHAEDPEIIARFDRLVGKVILNKLQKAGITMAVVDEVHNWKSGYSNGAEFFRKYIAPSIPYKLIMSATPIQLNETEMTAIYTAAAGEGSKGDRSLETVMQASSEKGPIQTCLRTQKEFTSAWEALTDQDSLYLNNALKSSTSSGDVNAVLEELSSGSYPATLSDFAKKALAYHKSLNEYTAIMRNICIRHTKDKILRGYNCGTDFIAPRHEALHQMYSVKGIENDGGIWDFIGMRAQQIIDRSLDKADSAKLLSGINSSYAAFREGAVGRKFDMVSINDPYVRFFLENIEKADHQKVRQTVNHCLNNLKHQKKTLVFCERLATQEAIYREVMKRLSEKTDESHDTEEMIRARRQRFMANDASRFYYSHCLTNNSQLDSEMRQKVFEKYREVVEQLGENALSQIQTRRIVDLCLVSVRGADTYWGQIADTLLNPADTEPLNKYLNDQIEEVGPDPVPLESNDSNILPEHEEKQTQITPFEQALKHLTTVKSIWTLPDSESILKAFSELVSCEYYDIVKKGSKEKSAENLAKLLRIAANGLRVISAPLHIFSHKIWGDEYGDDTAENILCRMTTTHKQGLCLQNDLQKFFEQLCKTNGSIVDSNTKDDGSKTLRGSLWEAAVTFVRIKSDVLLAYSLNGGTIDNKKSQTRTHVCQAFNTPLPPYILICTSVGQEGIDLHRQCADVVHHDLPWNPAKVEQRTGRVDRVDSLAERNAIKYPTVKNPLNVGIPFLASNYDEFAYNTVYSRAQKMEVLFGSPELSKTSIDEEPIDGSGILGAVKEADPESGMPESQTAEVSIPEILVDYFRVDLSCIQL